MNKLLTFLNKTVREKDLVKLFLSELDESIVIEIKDKKVVVENDKKSIEKINSLFTSKIRTILSYLTSKNLFVEKVEFIDINNINLVKVFFSINNQSKEIIIDFLYTFDIFKTSIEPTIMPEYFINGFFDSEIINSIFNLDSYYEKLKKTKIKFDKEIFKNQEKKHSLEILLTNLYFEGTLLARFNYILTLLKSLYLMEKQNNSFKESGYDLFNDILDYEFYLNKKMIHLNKIKKATVNIKGNVNSRNFLIQLKIIVKTDKKVYYLTNEEGMFSYSALEEFVRDFYEFDSNFSLFFLKTPLSSEKSSYSHYVIKPNKKIARILKQNGKNIEDIVIENNRFFDSYINMRGFFISPFMLESEGFFPLEKIFVDIENVFKQFI